MSSRTVHKPPSPGLVAQFAEIVGPAHALTDPDQQLPYLREWRDMYEGRAAVVLRPGSTEEVSRILALAQRASHRRRAAGRQYRSRRRADPVRCTAEIVLSVARLKRVRAVDAAGYTHDGRGRPDAGRGAGRRRRRPAACFRSACRRRAAAASAATSRTNAGGVGVLAYGNARAAGARPRGGAGRRARLGRPQGAEEGQHRLRPEGPVHRLGGHARHHHRRRAEAVPAPGREGDRVRGAAASSTTRWRCSASPQEPAGRGLTAFEFMPRIALEFVLRQHAGRARSVRRPAIPGTCCSRSPAPKADGSAERLLMDALRARHERGLIVDAVIAGSLGPGRATSGGCARRISEAQKPEGGNIKHDVSVPVARDPRVRRARQRGGGALCPGARPLAFGHFGDGNVHYNITQPVGMDRQALPGMWATQSATPCTTSSPSSAARSRPSTASAS